MTEISIPVQSTRTLIKAMLYAGLVAAVILLTIILPAEYRIDPTGAGKALGLMKLSASMPHAPATVVENVDKIAAVPSLKYRTDSILVSVQAGKGVEYKFHLLEGGSLEYSWSVERGALFFDFHGEPQGDTTGYFESFAVSTAGKVSGTHTAPFTGSHGWYWKNNSNTDLEVTLTTKGTYEIIGLK